MANDFSFAVAPGGVDTGLVATGSTITDALQLVATVNVFATVAASTGAKLPSGLGRGTLVVIRNGGATPLTLYPSASTGSINGGASFSVTNAKTALVYALGSDSFIGVLSA